MLVTCEQIQAAEERLFSSGVDAEPLMEKAGLGCARAIRQFFPEPAHAVVFVGKGNNGGDALVVARHLRAWGWAVSLRLASTQKDDVSELCWKKRSEIEDEPEWTNPDPLPETAPRVLIDGLLGIGARGPLRGKIGELAGEMNALREREHAVSFAVDIPSGVDGDTGEPYAGAVVTDFTLSITQVKCGVASEAAIDHIGRIVQIPLPDIAMSLSEAESEAVVLSPRFLRPLLPRRPFDFHKGRAGRVAIVAGSRGFTGAGRLCSLGALHGGAGLVTVFADESIYPIVANSAPPEVMVRPVSDFSEVRDFNADAIAIGPGIGIAPEAAEVFTDLMFNDPRPMVIDADGLTLLSQRLNPVESFQPAGPRLLTPHPGEMARLLGGSLPDDRSRIEITTDFTEHCPVSLLYKGARTVIAEKDRPPALNSTGHPGMATGGIGDVLTGLCAALIAQGLAPFDAASIGSWLIGRSAEIAIYEDGESAESLSAGHVAEGLGRAFESLRRGDY